MKFSVLALDYDGTIAMDGRFDSRVRDTIGEIRRRGIIVALVTGRRLDDLKQVAGDLTCFDVIVAENGATLEYPSSGRHVVLGRAPHPAFLQELKRRGIPFITGESVVEADAQWAGPMLEAIRALEQPLALAFNRDRLMVLPPAIGKSTGLRQALSALRLSVHNAVAIGDAENDHDLLDACEVGAAVGWGSGALRAVADEVIDGAGPAAVAQYIRQVALQPRLAATQMGRRNLTLGRQDNGDEVRLAVRGRTILIAGEPGTGKSWLAGLLCEQSILQGYSVCIIDGDGDYQSLEALPGVVTFGNDDELPTARELLRAMRHPDVSVIVDLSKVPDQAKREYVGTLLPLLATWRRSTGLPHKILLDRADAFLKRADTAQLIDPELAGYIFVTSRLSMLPDRVRATPDAVVLVTRESDPKELATLVSLCRPQPCAAVSPDMFRGIDKGEVALLPGTEEAQGRVRRFRLSPRLTVHTPSRTAR
jgi:hydroxymethylpyrimidine pyrophosphatase-like HAD family hydrolase